jgi:predicted O-linked N-acetylglucosamine transferase (SPINDLY family)
MTAQSLTPEAAIGLGLKHLQEGRPEDAAGVFVAVLAAAPGHSQAAYFLAAALDRLGRFADAAAALRRAVALTPAAAPALAALAPIVERLGGARARPERLARRALDAGFRAEDPTSCFNLAKALMTGGDAARAACLLRQGLTLHPAMKELANALGVIAFEASRPDATMRARRSLVLAPDRLDFRFTLAACLAHAGDTDRAGRLYRQVLSIAPDNAPAHNNLGLVFRNQSLIDFAIVAHRRALAIDPGDANLHRNHLSTLTYSQVEEWQHFAAHLAFGRAVRPMAPIAPLPRRRKDRLTIGYLSADLRDHPIARLLEPIVAHHDHSRFRIGLYGQGRRVDEISHRFVSLGDYTRDLTELDDAAAAARIRDDGVDVLVLVASHFDHNRPTIAAHRAAAVQVSLYDAATSGIDQIDYLIADPVLAPRAGGERFVERVVRVPRLLVTTSPPPLPTERRTGLAPVFGSFSAPAKLSPETLDLWARLLVRLPAARLLLKSYGFFASRALADRVRGRFAGAGIAERVEFRSAAEPLDRHLANYRDVDIALDPFPFNGSTTTHEAFWMGVPVVTLLGRRMPGRWTAPMLEAVGLGDLVARDADAYVEIAARLAADRARLADLRATLRDRVLASSLNDGRGRARQLERLYRAMWNRKT